MPDNIGHEGKIGGNKENIVDITPLLKQASELAQSIEDKDKGPLDSESNSKRRSLVKAVAAIGITIEDFRKWPEFYDRLFNPGTTQKIFSTDTDVEMLSHLREILAEQKIGIIFDKTRGKEKHQETGNEREETNEPAVD